MFLIHFYTCIDNLSLSPGFYQVAKLTMPLQCGMQGVIHDIPKNHH
ncbi:hypothetical protein [Candidatus Williamhamiltonella defendens]|nr:hypothetical protein [Candidatus Hamiltonella defensa]